MGANPTCRCGRYGIGECTECHTVLCDSHATDEDQLRCADCLRRLQKQTKAAERKKAQTLTQRVRAESARWESPRPVAGGHLAVRGGSPRLCEEPGFERVDLPPGEVTVADDACVRCAEVATIAQYELSDWLRDNAEWLLWHEEERGLVWADFQDQQKRRQWREEAASHRWYGYNEERNQQRFEARIFGDTLDDDDWEDDLDDDW